jgi:hypothetical protein
MKPVLAPEEINEEFVPIQSSRVHAVEIDGEAVLLDQRDNRLHRLNTSATIVWASFDGRSSIRDIAADLADELGLPGEQAVADVLAVTRSLGEQGLLEPLDCTPDDVVDEPAEQASESAAVAGLDPRFIFQPPNP